MCENLVCENGGTVVAAVGDCFCECEAGFTGTSCQSG